MCWLIFPHPVSPVRITPSLIPPSSHQPEDLHQFHSLFFFPQGRHEIGPLDVLALRVLFLSFSLSFFPPPHTIFLSPISLVHHSSGVKGSFFSFYYVFPLRVFLYYLEIPPLFSIDLQTTIPPNAKSDSFPANLLPKKLPFVLG